jgi:histidyl-tRNA synthetase
MSEIIRAPKGVPDYAQNDGIEFLAIRDSLSEPIKLSGYQYIELPIYEDTNLYVRGVGESTDVVSKEMFTFSDRGSFGMQDLSSELKDHKLEDIDSYSKSELKQLGWMIRR